VFSDAELDLQLNASCLNLYNGRHLNGKKQEVIVDHVLPYSKQTKEPAFIMTLGPAQDVIECWPGLLLKALAKHNGTYLGLKTLGFPTLV